MGHVCMCMSEQSPVVLEGPKPLTPDHGQIHLVSQSEGHIVV